MDLNEQKQQFSFAFLRAVSAVAGLAISRSDTDDDSIDATLAVRGGAGTIKSPKLDLQLKCTAMSPPAGDAFNFVLKRKNYDDLIATDVMVPRILVVVIVPDNLNEWLSCGPNELVLRHCAYWYSLRGMAPTENTASMTLSIPVAQIFDAAQLSHVFERLKAGGPP